MSRNTSFLSLALLSMLIVCAIFFGKGALNDSPWDAPIYLSRGKAVAEEHYLRDMASHAEKTAANLPDYKAGENTPYWYFMRLGNILIIGGLVTLLGSGMAAIQATFLLYTLLLVASVVFGVLLYFRISDATDHGLPNNKAILLGGSMAGVAYLASDAYRHLSGAFVAEIPALFFITSSAWALVAANSRRSIWLAIISGVLGFALYAVKIEGVWAYLSFCIVYGLVYALRAPEKIWWSAMFVSGLTALLLYAVYSWWLWPLTDPRLLPVFTKAFQTNIPNPVAPFKIWIAAGGLLWIGLFLGILYKPRSPVLWMSLAWLGMLSLPYLDNLINNRGTTVLRNFAIIMPPLLLASAVGWSALASKLSEGKISRYTLPVLITLITGLLALSHAESYAYLKQLPGGWRLQQAKELLSPAPYERQDYPIHGLAEIARHVYGDGKPTMVVMGKGVTEEHLTLISFFGPPSTRAPFDEFRELGKPSPACGTGKFNTGSVTVMYCAAPPTPEVMNELIQAGYRLLYLHGRASVSDPAYLPSDQMVLMSHDLVLSTEPARH